MMMKMLIAGGFEPLTDNIRTADEDNPEGYFEFERVKQLKVDQAWLQDARGKCIKIVSAFLKHLPQNFTYKIIFMRRNISEVLASQQQMLLRRGEPIDTIGDEKMRQTFERHLKDLDSWLAGQPNIALLNINYNEVIVNPLPSIQIVRDFLDVELDAERMLAVVNKNLYRNRG
jgi:argonaute-like protein implicated in RNA metabolism and viral defense